MTSQIAKPSSVLLSIFRTFKAEYFKQISLTKAYPQNVIFSQILFFLTFIFFLNLADLLTGNFDPSLQAVFLIAFILWRISLGIIQDTAFSISDDLDWGTFEQIFIVGNSLSITSFGKSLFITFYYLVRSLILMTIIILTTQIAIPLNYAIVSIFFISLLSTIGLALLIVSFQIIYKNISSTVAALTTILFFTSGALTSLKDDTWLYAFTRLLPLSSGIDLIRTTYLNSYSFSEVVQLSSFIEVLFNSFFYFFAGWLSLLWAQKKATEIGSLGHY